MTERQHTHAAAHVEPASAAPEISPGRSRSSNLVAPTHPIVSGLIRRKARDANGVAADADVAIASASGGTGAPLPSTLQRKFEASLGADLSGVRVHTDASSASAADSVGARAYTIGRDIHFGAGHYDPSSVAGEHLLAHKYQLTGGYIRNACLRAAFLAAQEETALQQHHLERAVALEFAELGKLSNSGAID